MLINLMPAPAGEHRWGASYVRQQVSPGEQFRRGNAKTILIVALHAAPVSRARWRGTSVFQVHLAALVDAALPEHACGKPLELWRQDEARIGQQGTLTRIWAKGACDRQRRATSAVSGPICSGLSVQRAASVPGWCCRLPCRHDEPAPGRDQRHRHARAQAIPTVDGAGWHQVGDKLHVRGNITLRLPPYSPEP